MHDDALRAEARAFARYLIDVDPSDALAERYAAACRVHFAGERDERDARLVALARRHPRLVGPLDAAAGLLRPGCILRKKVLLMAAVLEATPEHAREFLPRTSAAPALALRLAGLGLAAVCKVVLGVLLLALVRR